MYKKTKENSFTPNRSWFYFHTKSKYHWLTFISMCMCEITKKKLKKDSLSNADMIKYLPRFFFFSLYPYLFQIHSPPPTNSSIIPRKIYLSIDRNYRNKYNNVFVAIRCVFHIFSSFFSGPCWRYSRWNFKRLYLYNQNRPLKFNSSWNLSTAFPQIYGICVCVWSTNLYIQYTTYNNNHKSGRTWNEKQP